MKIVTLKEENIFDLLILSEHQVRETIPHVPFEMDVVLHNAEWIAENPEGDTRIYVAYTDDGKPAGYLVAYVRPYLFNRRLSVGQEVVYVLPEYRGTRAFLMLMRRLDKLAQEVNALECYGCVANGRKMDSALKWFVRHNYEKVGFYVRKVFT